jgi:cation:H+ antiporter
MTYLQLVLGLLLLLAGGDFLVRGSVGVARALGVSPLFIGLTLVGFGTSAPELVASLIAALRESPGIAVGNVVGSNIANILLILGLAAIAAPLPVSRQAFHRDAIALAVSTAVAAGVIEAGGLGRPAGLAMILLLIAYVTFTYRAERRRPDAESELHEQEAAQYASPPHGVLRPLAVAVAALGGVVFGARLLVDAAIALSSELGVSDAVIGLTVVAVGTSLPELAVSVLAALRGQGAVAVGNVVGSNIYNALFILGTTAAVHPISTPRQIAGFDVWVLLAVTAVLLAFMLRGARIGRVAGVAMLAGYAAYVLRMLH